MELEQTKICVTLDKRCIARVVSVPNARPRGPCHLPMSQQTTMTRFATYLPYACSGLTTRLVRLLLRRAPHGLDFFKCFFREIVRKTPLTRWVNLCWSAGGARRNAREHWLDTPDLCRCPFRLTNADFPALLTMVATIALG
jgi:hypothetical protein